MARPSREPRCRAPPDAEDGRGEGVPAEGPPGPASLFDLFEGRRQLIVCRLFFEPGVADWPKGGCRGCSFLADQVAHLVHPNARDTTLAFVARAPQPDIERWKLRMG